jgi:hypothetical protein
MAIAPTPFCEALRAGMPGIDSLYSQNKQVEHDIGLVNPCIKIISANLFSKAQRAFANAFQPAYASAIA